VNSPAPHVQQSRVVSRASGIVITNLNAANKFGEAAIEVVTGNVQIATGPRPAKIPAD
jgi:hypothetical protein